MAKPVFDISVLGDKQLEKALAALHPRLQKKVGRQAIKASAKRAKAKAIAFIPVDTGRYRAAMEASPVKSLGRSRVFIGWGPDLPERHLLGLSTKNKDPETGKRIGYYPAFVEYGTRTMRAQAPIRRATNMIMKTEQRQIGVDIGKGIKREWKKGKHWIKTGKK